MSKNYEPLNCLSALALARETGCRVRPKDSPLGLVVDHDGEAYRYRIKGGGDGYLGKLRLQELINTDGSEVIWEVVEK